MRYFCYFCGKSVSSELPDDSVIRACLVCPECVERGEIIIPDKGVMVPCPCGHSDKPWHYPRGGVCSVGAEMVIKG